MTLWRLRGISPVFGTGSSTTLGISNRFAEIAASLHARPGLAVLRSTVCWNDGKVMVRDFLLNCTQNNGRSTTAGPTKQLGFGIGWI